ncbi:hypothetical protein HDU93_006618 [Gonapodya sp. JEL0774]|nr:hypothetical protein HDU93_006618 [Gonapodya sp. JEL0774]
MASEGANGRLLEAIEANNLEEVTAAIKDGADVRLARKRITLVVHIDGKVNAESAYGEGTMALAIRGGNYGIVEALLAADYDPNSPIEWKFPAYPLVPPWTQLRWDHQTRWNSTAPFSSLLDFALASGDGWAFNKRGANITVTDPLKFSDVCDTYTLQPSLDVIRLLILHNARIDKTEFKTRAKSPLDRKGQSYDEYFTQQQMEAIARAAKVDPDAISLAQSLADQTKVVDEMRRQLADYRERIWDLEKERNGWVKYKQALERDVMEAKTMLSSMGKAKGENETALRRQIETLTATQGEHEALIAQQREQISMLTQQAAEADSLRRQLADARRPFSRASTIFRPGRRGVESPLFAPSLPPITPAKEMEITPRLGGPESQVPMQVAPDAAKPDSSAK